MNPRRTLLRVAGIGGIAALTVAVGLRVVHTSPAAPSAQEPIGVRDFVCAQAFRLDQGYAHTWRREQPWTTCGWLLVLEVDPALATVQDELERVLFVGDEVPERTNPGDLAGRRVVILPATPGADGWPVLDVLSQPMWFGERALPEQLDRTLVQAARERAELAGITPFALPEIGAALECGEARVVLADRAALHHRVAELVLLHAPEERDFAYGLQSQLVR